MVLTMGRVSQNLAFDPILLGGKGEGAVVAVWSWAKLQVKMSEKWRAPTLI